MKEYNPYWPENILMVGAGATAKLGMLSTADLGKSLLKLASGEEHESLTDKVSNAFPDMEKGMQRSIEKMLRLLEGKDVKGFTPKRMKVLRDVYDWTAVKQIVKRCPGVSEGKLDIQDVYNLIDMHIQTGHGFMVGTDMVRPERMFAARNTVNMLTSVIHASGFHKTITKHSEDYKEYYEFALVLSKLMQDEGIKKEKDSPLNTRNFYLFSYAVISMNWDPIFLWLFFNAHKELNDNQAPYIGEQPSPMKLFHDMAHFMAVRAIGGPTPEASFPMNETAVQRLNDPEHATGRRVRIGKFYFPHGCHGFRECPNCGKLTFYLGNEWGISSETLFPPQIIRELAYEDSARSIEERNAHEDGTVDAIQCTHCGTMTEANHSAIVMQTNFKGNHPPFIEEIQRDMKVAIEKAKHIILFGYSFPSDDFTYRSIFAARKQMGKDEPYCSIVNYDENAEDRWMYGDEMDKFAEKYPEGISEIYKRMVPLFGKEKIRVYGYGIPKVFMKDNKTDKIKVEQLMDWDSGSKE